MEKPTFTFESPDTGKTYTSEHPIEPGHKKNLLHTEEMKKIDGLRDFALELYRTILNNEDKLGGFKEMLGEHGKELTDLLLLKNRHPAEQQDAIRFVRHFFDTENKEVQKATIGHLAALLR